MSATSISDWLRHRAESTAGLVALFAWGVAEALIWPLIPDISLAVLVLSRPRRWAALTFAAVSGSVVGGVIGWTGAAAGWRWPLPLTTPRMHTTVEGWFASGGVEAMAHQPMSGVPYKVFVASAPDAGVGLGPFALATLHHRGLRMLATALITACVAAVIWRVIPDRIRAEVHVGITIGGSVAFLAALALVFRGWS